MTRHRAPHEPLVRTTAIFDFVARYSATFCGPVVIGYPPRATGEDGRLVGNASGTLLNIGGRDLLITNQHVLEIFRKELASDERIGLHFFGRKLVPTIVDESTSCDLAVLDVRGMQFERDDPDFPPFEFFKPAQWPTDDAQEGDIVYIGGWPEIHREERDGGAELHFGKFDVVIAHVTGAFYDKFTCKFDRSRWTSRHGDTSYEQDRRMSGMSGGPIFREKKAAVLTIELVGFVMEHDPDLDVLKATSASNIRSDCTLKK